MPEPIVTNTKVTLTSVLPDVTADEFAARIPDDRLKEKYAFIDMIHQGLTSGLQNVHTLTPDERGAVQGSANYWQQVLEKLVVRLETKKPEK